jgi:NADH-quinone oxidoreductase subunit C
MTTLHQLIDRVAGLEVLASDDGIDTARVEAAHLVAAARTLHELGYQVLLDLVPIDRLPREPRYEVSYLLLDPGVAGPPAHLRLKVLVGGAEPRLPTVAGVWRSANWAEREAYDFYGIFFDGHPDLRRLLMPEDWDGFPMRKDYPVQIKEPVKTYEPMQLTAEEFAANVEAARGRASR